MAIKQTKKSQVNRIAREHTYTQNKQKSEKELTCFQKKHGFLKITPKVWVTIITRYFQSSLKPGQILFMENLLRIISTFLFNRIVFNLRRLQTGIWNLRGEEFYRFVIFVVMEFSLYNSNKTLILLKSVFKSENQFLFIFQGPA